ncbi:MAG: DUF3085 domain-containing protein, partial [Pseudomonadota bacterium]|nr:DUF3085 domain-containing protein [Pseudomonadota bacterium]
MTIQQWTGIFMGYLDFDVRALGPLVNHVKAAPERLPSFPYNTDSSLLAKGATLTAEEAEIGASGAKVDGHKVPAHLILARDAGVYLMSAGYPELLVEGGREPHLVHARNLTPDGDWVTAADAAVGHKDFAIGLPLDWFEAAIEGGLDTLTLNVTEAAVNPVITGDWRRKSRVPRVLTVRRKPAATEASGGQATPND